MITKDYIYNRVIRMTRRDELEDIDDYLLEALKEISLRTGYIRKTESYTLSEDERLSNRYSFMIDKPSNMISIANVLSESGYIYPQSLNYVDGGGLGWHETSSGIHIGGLNVGDTVEIDYSAYHSDDLTDIEFPDIYQQAIINLCASKIYSDYEIEDKAENMRMRFETDLLRLPIADDSRSFVKIRR